MLYSSNARTLVQSLLFFVFLTVFMTACDKDDDNPPEQVNFTLSGNASGSQEVPAVTTTATGTLAGTYNKETNALAYTITWTGLSGPPTGSHFHGPAAVGVPAGVALAITIPTGAGTSGTLSGSATLTEIQEADLLGEKWYYNFHTAAHGGGEIRGQVNVQ